MGFRTPNFQQFQQPQQQKQFQDQDQDLQPVGKRQKGTGFTNIGKILGANVGAGERMGRQVGQAVGMQAGQARAGVTQAQEKFETAKKEAEQKADLAQQGIKKVLDDSSGLAGLTEEQAKERRERFLKEGQYTGPKGLEQEAQLKARAEALGDVATMGMSGRGGRQQLARSIVAGPGMYTRGQSLLDATLLGQSAAAQRAIEAGSRQALGAQQEIAKSALSAQEQAKASESALSKEKADIVKKVGEKFEEVGTAGETAAKQFADDINRFNQLMTATRSVDDKGNYIYKDASGNLMDITDRDKQLISNPERFGLEAREIKIDPRSKYSELTKGILGDVAQQGAFTYQKGMTYYTPEQQAIARNLALFKGETPAEYKPFETDIFKTGAQNIADKSEYYRGLKSQQAKDIEGLNPEYAKKLYDMFGDPTGQYTNPFSWIKDQRNLGDIEGWKKFYDFIKPGASFSVEGPSGVSREYGQEAIQNIGNAIQEYERAVQKEKSLQTRGQSLKDYLANLYDLPEIKEAAPFEPETRRPIRQV